MERKCIKNGCISPPLERKELNDNPVKLCHDITRLSRAKAREMSVDGVMSQPGARLVLGLLAICDGVSQRALVQETHLRPPTVSVILAKMEEEGMVERRKNPDDKREVRVYLTERGREVDMKVISNIKATDSLGVAGLSDEEIDTLMMLLGRVRNNFLLALEDSKKEERE